MSVQLMLCFVFPSGYKVVVDSGVESVKLPCKIRVHVPKDAKVEWTDNSISNRKVYVSDQVEEQDKVYRDRTEMKRKLLKPGDLSLTLKYPTDKDTNTYTCTVCSREGNQSSMKKKVELIIPCVFHIILKLKVGGRPGPNQSGALGKILGGAPRAGRYIEFLKHIDIFLYEI
uniref:Ig-like domain-containing protein n=1 Tax=Haplochromis burtoni TaxID=8153 RepID=A0A3Q2WUW5_HAPBU